LTQNKINLQSEDFAIWLDRYSLPYDNQNLAASILAKFREILLKISEDYKSVTISQLSDCAFVWSENIKDVIIVANNIMSNCISEGVLCRGGLAYGEIIETSQSHKLGRFILGNAVTEAVKLEGIAKGCRIMINDEFPGNLFTANENFSNDIYPLFQSFINPLDFETYDEFKWYFVPFMNDTFSFKDINTKKKAFYTNHRLKLANKIGLDPKFSWNARNSLGNIHLKSSINFLSETNDSIFKVSHNFNWEDVYDNRSVSSLKRAEKLIDDEIR
jgi:hypothetical protein